MVHNTEEPQSVADELDNSCDVLLVTMPWATVSSPSIQLSLLKPVLQNSGFSCNVLYANLGILPYVGQKVYGRLMEYPPLGEWLFSRELFGDFSPRGVSSLDYFGFINDRSKQHVLQETGSIPESDLLENLFEKDYRIILQRIRNESIPRYLEELLKSIHTYNAEVIGFTSTFYQNIPSLALAKAIKREAPSKTIVLGGANCEGVMGPALLRNFRFVDFVVSGEGERAFPRLLENLLRRKGLLSQVSGVSIREGEYVHIGGMAESCSNLDALPLLDCDDYFQQATELGKREKMALERGPILFEGSRGCWWGSHSHCTFCGLNGTTIGFRGKSARRIFDEILYLASRYRLTNFEATDNILNPRYLASVLPAFRDSGFDFDLYFEVKATMTKDQVKLLAAAGARRLQPGIESLSTHVLELMGKGTTMLQNLQALKWFEEYHIRPNWHLLFGFPGETEKDFAGMEIIIPWVHHLHPPSNRLNRIEMHRFSPNFDFADRLGFRNVRPIEHYNYSYDLPKEELVNIAYNFDYELDISDAIYARVASLNKFVSDWRERYENSSGSSLLSYRIGPDFVEVRDKRGNDTRRIVLLENAKDILLSCDRIRTFGEVADIFTKSGTPLPESRHKAFGDHLVQRRLVVLEG